MAKEIRFFNVQQFGRDFGTLNLNPGKKVYGERLIQHGGKEYRTWDIYRSKIAAAIEHGLQNFPFKENTKILYLGAGNGTTVSHFSDVCTQGQIFAVEFSARSAIDLFMLAKQRKNIVPLLADANHLLSYLAIAPEVDVIYQDIAQRDQTRTVAVSEILSAFFPRIFFKRRNDFLPRVLGQHGADQHK